METIDGYMIRVRWDGQTLRVHGTSKMARVALNGADHGDDVVLAKAEIEQAQLRDATMLVNGSLTVRTVAGRKHVLHFRRKHQADFARLAEVLGS
jgi:hypothetical protein